MGRLIRTALFSVSKALQHQIRAYRSPLSEDWGRAAEGFRLNDPYQIKSDRLSRRYSEALK